MATLDLGDQQKRYQHFDFGMYRGTTPLPLLIKEGKNGDHVGCAERFLRSASVASFSGMDFKLILMNHKTVFKSP